MPLFLPTVTPWVIESVDLAGTISAGSFIANTVYLYAVEFYATLTIASMRYRTGATSAGTTDCGIYDVNGNKLGSTGATANAVSTIFTTNLTSNLTLSPGQYFLALCPSSSSDTYYGLNDLALAVFVRTRTATNTGTAGVLPGTTGGSTRSTLNPCISAIQVGGIS